MFHLKQNITNKRPHSLIIPPSLVSIKEYPTCASGPQESLSKDKCDYNLLGLRRLHQTYTKVITFYILLNLYFGTKAKEAVI